MTSSGLSFFLDKKSNKKIKAKKCFLPPGNRTPRFFATPPHALYLPNHYDSSRAIILLGFAISPQIFFDHAAGS
jgi:hypothetical protein